MYKSVILKRSRIIIGKRYRDKLMKRNSTTKHLQETYLFNKLDTTRTYRQSDNI